MEIIIKDSYEEISKEAAEIIRAALLKKPNLVLGLATGNTPIGLYDKLARMHKAEGLDFSRVVTFNLDEYVGIPVDHPESYHTFMERYLFSTVNTPASNHYIPQSTTDNLEEFCEGYEERIRHFGGIDIQVLGIGTNGHIGFNEPSSSLGSRTRLKTLAPATIQAHLQNFGGDAEAVPRMAITMGIGTIMEAKQCLLLANGESKADTIARCIEGPITAEVPASALQMHPRSIILVDEAAASRLKRIDYYKWAYENKLRLAENAQK
ncbi:glucosamine-6-phosphate deaminase [Candidatus Poribacteria bacterium]|nr:glucosamine-6-phosphate deaminase [Candidatus Poribacteria bacterium]